MNNNWWFLSPILSDREGGGVSGFDKRHVTCKKPDGWNNDERATFVGWPSEVKSVSWSGKEEERASGRKQKKFTDRPMKVGDSQVDFQAD